MPEDFLDDKELISGYLEGRNEYLEILIQRYLKLIYNFIYARVGDESVAEDLTQETFVKVWRSFKTFDITKGFKTWLFRIAKNTLIDWLRKQKRLTTPISLDESFSFEGKIESLNRLDYLPPEILEKAESIQQLDEAINQLPDKYQLIMTAYYHEERDLKEISMNFQMPYNTVKSYYRRAVILIKKLIQ